MRDIAGEARANLCDVSQGPQLIDVPVLADQQERIYIGSALTQDVV